MQLKIDGEVTFIATGNRPHDPEKPTVLFVHGTGQDHTIWVLPTRYFARHDRNVLAVDLPGHGRSGGAPLNTIEEMADWLNDVVTVLGIDNMAWFDDSDSFWGQFPESAQAEFRQALSGFDREVTSEVTQQVRSWSYTPENPIQDVGVAHVHNDWLKGGAQDAYGELSEDWVAFLEKVGYPYQINCMRTVVGSQKTTCVTFADNLSRFTSDETWDNLIEAAGAEEEFQSMLDRWQSLVLRWEHMDASYVASMSYWPAG